MVDIVVDDEVCSGVVDVVEERVAVFVNYNITFKW